MREPRADEMRELTPSVNVSREEYDRQRKGVANPIPYDEWVKRVTARKPKRERVPYLTGDQALHKQHCVNVCESAPLAYEVWGQKTDAKPGDNDPVLLDAYWDVRAALRDASGREQSCCDCRVVVANGLEWDCDAGAYFLRSDVL